MRFFQAPSASSFLSTFALLSLRHAVVIANPVYALVHSSVILVERQGCQNPCGYQGWLCCAADQQCFTDSNNQAQCGTLGPVTQAEGGGEGYWQYWTSTWVETNLVTMTSVYSSFVGATAQANPTAVCNIPCGQNCCGWGQYCLNTGTGQCANSGGTTQATVSPTTTVPFEPALPTGETPVGMDGSGGLSGGAIAGIVIGVLAGILLLILLCLFCCARGIFNTLMALLGLRKKKRVEETYIQSHHSGTGAGGRWYGQGPARPPKEKKSRFGGLGAAGAVLGGLALALGLKRRHDRKDEKSDYTSSYSYSDYTSSSSSSSDRRTRQTRHSSRR